MVFPVATAFAVTWVAFEVAEPWLGASPLDIVIPALVTLCPARRSRWRRWSCRRAR